MTTCKWCGTEYEPDETDGRSRYWCSKKCMNEAKADYLYDRMKDEKLEKGGL